MRSAKMIGMIGALAVSCWVTQAVAGMWEIIPPGTWQELLIGGVPGTPGNVFSAQGEDYSLTGAQLSSVTPDPSSEWDWIAVYTNATLTLSNGPAAPWANGCDASAGWSTVFETLTIKSRSTRFLADTNPENDGLLEFDLSATSGLAGFSAGYSGFPTYQDVETNKIASGELSSAAIEFGMTVRVNVKGGSPISPVNMRSRGVLPVVVRGIDVRMIDPAWLRLECVPPLRWAHGANQGQGRTLMLKFSTQAIAATLGDVPNRSRVTLHLTGQLKDGTPISGSAQITVLKPGRPHAMGMAHGRRW